ncbi:MAG: carbon-nitrogen hydrolase family protein [Verrucomicrobia bacterium]|nr:carbon-nitrogen hydrolase family protein [Verrucomicrobiota bacterium]
MKSTALTVAAVQMKFRPTIAGNTAWIVGVIKGSARAGADVVLFPECAVTGYNRDLSVVSRCEVEAALEAIARAARAARCHVLVGCPTFAGQKRFNSLLVFDRRGREVFRYSKIHLTERDTRSFSPGKHLALFPLEGVPCTAIICHERRYPELVRLPVMAGAQIVFHPNAGLDSLSVSKAKRGGRDGIPVRAFENQVYYVFANSVGPQGSGLWSAGDSKIVGPDGRVLALADNRREQVIRAPLDLARAGRCYAREGRERPACLRPYWRAMISLLRRQSRRVAREPGRGGSGGGAR